MDATQHPVDIDYDAEHDVLRIFVCKPSPDAIAIPGPSGVVTVIVSGELDRIYGLVFENYAASMPHARASDSAAEREQSFRDSLDVLRNVIPSTIEALAPLAKDRAARWLEGSFAG